MVNRMINSSDFAPNERIRLNPDECETVGEVEQTATFYPNAKASPSDDDLTSEDEVVSVPNKSNISMDRLKMAMPSSQSTNSEIPSKPEIRVVQPDVTEMLVGNNTDIVGSIEQEEYARFKKWTEENKKAKESVKEMTNEDPNLMDDSVPIENTVVETPKEEDDEIAYTEDSMDKVNFAEMPELRLDTSNFADFDETIDMVKEDKKKADPSYKSEHTPSSSELISSINPIDEDEDDSVKVSSTEIKKELDYKEETSKVEICELPKSKFFLESEGLSSIVIKNSAKITDRQALKNIRNRKPASTVVLAQSGYSCQISAITNREIQIMNDSYNTEFESTDKIYGILHSKISKMPFGKLTYEDWLKVTSYFDIQTLEFGIYCQTYPNITKYKLNCNNPKCRKEFDLAVAHTDLAIIDNEKYIERMNDILKNVKTIKDLNEYSLLTKTRRIQLPESGIIIDFRIPSLYQYLNDTAKALTPELIDKYSDDTIIAVSFIDKLYLPDSFAYEDNGSLQFIPVVDNADQIQEINDFSPADGAAFVTELEDFAEQYRIEYAIRKVKCPKCGHEIGDIPIDMASMLFLAQQNLRTLFRKKKD